MVPLAATAEATDPRLSGAASHAYRAALAERCRRPLDAGPSAADYGSLLDTAGPKQQAPPLAPAPSSAQSERTPLSLAQPAQPASDRAVAPAPVAVAADLGRISVGPFANVHRVPPPAPEAAVARRSETLPPAASLVPSSPVVHSSPTQTVHPPPPPLQPLAPAHASWPFPPAGYPSYGGPVPSSAGLHALPLHAPQHGHPAHWAMPYPHMPPPAVVSASPFSQPPPYPMQPLPWQQAQFPQHAQPSLAQPLWAPQPHAAQAPLAPSVAQPSMGAQSVAPAQQPAPVAAPPARVRNNKWDVAEPKPPAPPAPSLVPPAATADAKPQPPPPPPHAHPTVAAAAAAPVDQEGARAAFGLVLHAVPNTSPAFLFNLFAAFNPTSLSTDAAPPVLEFGCDGPPCPSVWRLLLTHLRSTAADRDRALSLNGQPCVWNGVTHVLQLSRAR